MILLAVLFLYEILQIYNSESKDYAEIVLRQRGFIKEFKGKEFIKDYELQTQL